MVRSIPIIQRPLTRLNRFWKTIRDAHVRDQAIRAMNFLLFTVHNKLRVQEIEVEGAPPKYSVTLIRNPEEAVESPRGRKKATNFEAGSSSSQITITQQKKNASSSTGRLEPPSESDQQAAPGKKSKPGKSSAVSSSKSHQEQRIVSDRASRQAKRASRQASRDNRAGNFEAGTSSRQTGKGVSGANDEDHPRTCAGEGIDVEDHPRTDTGLQERTGASIDVEDHPRTDTGLQERTGASIDVEDHPRTDTGLQERTGASIDVEDHPRTDTGLQERTGASIDVEDHPRTDTGLQERTGASIDVEDHPRTDTGLQERTGASIDVEDHPRTDTGLQERTGASIDVEDHPRTDTGLQERTGASIDVEDHPRTDTGLQERTGASIDVEDHPRTDTGLTGAENQGWMDGADFFNDNEPEDTGNSSPLSVSSQPSPPRRRSTRHAAGLLLRRAIPLSPKTKVPKQKKVDTRAGHERLEKEKEKLTLQIKNSIGIQLELGKLVLLQVLFLDIPSELHPESIPTICALYETKVIEVFQAMGYTSWPAFDQVLAEFKDSPSNTLVLAVRDENLFITGSGRWETLLKMVDEVKNAKSELTNAAGSSRN